MSNIKTFDMSKFPIAISRDLSISLIKETNGPPPRVDGMTVGFVEMTREPPHNGEQHPDGDELIIVISGGLKVVVDSAPESPYEIRPGEACIIPRGEWHRVELLESTQLIYVTPGPNGNFRPKE